MSHYVMLAMDVANERVREAEQARLRSALVSQAMAARPARRSVVRRSTARVLAGVSLASAAVVRRLDDCVADDLGRSLAPTE